MIDPVEYDKLKEEEIPFTIVRAEAVPVSLDNVSVTLEVPAFDGRTGEPIKPEKFVISMAEIDNQIKNCKTQMETWLEKMDGYAQMKADVEAALKA